MATMDDDSVPIEVDSNGDEKVAEIDSMPTQKTATIQAKLVLISQWLMVSPLSAKGS